MIKFNTKILIILILITSSCSSLDSLRQSYKNLYPSSNESYIVQQGDSIWSIAINFNLDSDLLIKNNNLKKPYIIYPNQELFISSAIGKSNLKEQSQAIEWHHPLGEKSKIALKDNSWLISIEPIVNISYASPVAGTNNHAE